MMVPSFRFANLVIDMLRKGVNPKIIGKNGTAWPIFGDEVEKVFKTKEAFQLCQEFSISIHYSTEDINCTGQWL